MTLTLMPSWYEIVMGGMQVDGIHIFSITESRQVRYTDQRLTAEQFASVKAKLPWGQLPTIKYNGTMLTQSMAIAR